MPSLSNNSKNRNSQARYFKYPYRVTYRWDSRIIPHKTIREISTKSRPKIQCHRICNIKRIFSLGFQTVGSNRKMDTQQRKILPGWIETIARFDALCSLATFRFNHPEYTFPVLNDNDNPVMKATELGHPLIEPERCVRNPVEMLQRPSFLVITGANMAGKSTYLRTIGINHLLACIGAPVCAKEMQLSPCKLFTSLRTTDSLSDQESYFFAELKRLKQIIDRLESGEKLFIILDEILKGTNSTDKQKGSLAFGSKTGKTQCCRSYCDA